MSALDRATSVQARPALMATTVITRMLVHLTDTTALTTSLAVSSLVPVPGSMASTAVAVTTVAADTMDTVGTTVAAAMLRAALTGGPASLAADPALPDAVASTHAVASEAAQSVADRLAADSGAALLETFTAAVVSMAVEVEADSTAVGVPMVAALTEADTGNFRKISN